MENFLDTRNQYGHFPPGFGGWNVMNAYKLQLKSKSTEKGIKKQCQGYIGWINSQLAKRPNTKPVEDLSKDLRDGIVLVHLLNIVGVTLEGFIPIVQNLEDKLHNIDLVLKFMKDSKIPMHCIDSQDIVSGDLKSTLRLILAIAAYYKPSAVRPSHTHKMAAAGFAHSASTVLAEARQHVSAFVRKPQKPASMDTFEQGSSTMSMYEDSSDFIKQNGTATQHQELIYAYATLSQEYFNLIHIHDEVVKELLDTKFLAEQLFTLVSEGGKDDMSLIHASKIKAPPSNDEECRCTLSRTFHQMHRLLNELEEHHRQSNCMQNLHNIDDANRNKMMKELFNQMNRISKNDLIQPNTDNIKQHDGT